jgi:uncharacterized membrane protein YkoI
MKHTIAVVLALLAPATAFAGNHHKHTPKLSLEEARAIALAKIPGHVKAEELEHEKHRWIYSFEIHPDGEKRKHLVKEVNIDSDTGAIVEIDTERE